MYKISTTDFMQLPRCVHKVFRLTKPTFFLLLISLLHVSASGLAQNITINQKKISLVKVFREIRSQTGYSSVWTDTEEKNKTFNVSLTNAPLEAALKQILAQTNLSYSIDKENRAILIFTKPNTATVSPPGLIDVKGVVVNVLKQPLLGATVKVKNSAISTQTGADGSFRLAGIASDAVLMISYVGYAVKEINASPDMGTIPLEFAANDLESVNVTFSTGYQTLSRERSAGSFSKPSLSVMNDRSSSTNVLQRLDGLVPGLAVNNAPDAGNNPFLIRGLSSINSNRGPLVVLDGVQVPDNFIQNINMQDVADITVLKDATSSSIWGAKAANGVIVITTKKGTADEKLKIDYDGYHNFQGMPDLSYIQKMNSGQFIATAKELFPQYVGSNSYNSVQLIAPVTPHLQAQYDASRGLITQAQANAKLDSLAGIDNSDQLKKYFYRQAATTNHTLSVSGGGKTHSFYGSANYIGTVNNTPGQTDDQYKINLRQDFKFNKRLQVYLITDLTNRVTRSNNITVPSLDLVPYQLFADPAGNPLIVNHMGNYSDDLRKDYQARSRINLDYSPLQEIENGYTKGNALSTRVVAGVTLELIKGLRYEGTFGYNINSFKNRVQLDQNSYAVRDEVMTFTQAPTLNSTPIYNVPAFGGRLTATDELLKSWTIRNQFLYDHTWLDKHQLTIMAGQEATSNSPLSTTTIYRGWDDQLQVARPINYQLLGEGITGTVAGGTRTLANNVTGGEGVISRTSSYFANLGYTFDRKYTLNSSIRIDRSNLFGFDQSAQNRPVWSVGGKWALGREEFMKPVNWLSRLDLRFTYGITGNAPTPGTAASWDILRAETNVNYPNGVGLIINAPANKKLTWELTKNYNLGLDFEILNGILFGSIDGYIRKTNDLIGNLTTAPLTGFASVIGNFGDLQNKGLDISLGSLNISNNNFTWTTSFTLGYNKNKISRLANATPITTGPGMISTRFLDGYPSFVVFAYDYAGLNASGDPQVKLADGTVTSNPTATTAQDVVYMGSSQPVYSGGFSNNFRYKNVTLGINIIYNGGNVMFRDVNTFWSGVPYLNYMTSEFANRWKVAGDENKTDIPRYAATSAVSGNRNTNYYTYANSNVFNASFAKIRDITLAYDVRGGLIKKLHAQSITFRAQVSNLMLWKANDLGIDPEFQSLGNVGATQTAGNTGAIRNLRTGQGTITLGAHITL
ncbi:SusC/RagA family TonB-linked outer membrane protein [Pedobacter sp. SG908]|uniref:SusC/RagA family TonB-linked outer membrane protein n=1 Tax=Pedobacter sp. SG908 TaxID=2587135 RepID=UPI001422C69B|nr:SusC/RagA family TonB-linked outer membrane protein [Pedobacter sp. SG908]NII81020.1 TonB-linked SusC/RagA family outer membrane protein [Pedobacter sp. SG908]